MVNISDVNDNSPVFGLQRYKFDASEDFPVGTALGSIKAVDKDTGDNALVKYTLLRADIGKAFDCFFG